VLIKRVKSYEKIGEKIEIKHLLKDFVRERLESKSKVVLKPNFLKWSNPEDGCVTHPGLVKEIARFFGRLGKEVYILEGGFSKDVSDRYFDEYGLREVAECINLNRHEFVNVQIGGEKLKSVSVSKQALTLLKDSFFVSIPKLKVHHLTLVTLGIKNNMGFLKKPAMNMHLGINKKLVDLLRVFNPNLVVIDGVIGGEGSEGNTKPVSHGVVVVGDNVVEVDSVGAYLMGFNPEEIGFLRLAGERGYGEYRMDRIDVVGEDVHDIHSLRVKYRISGLRRLLGRLSI